LCSSIPGSFSFTSAKAPATSRSSGSVADPSGGIVTKTKRKPRSGGKKAGAPGGVPSVGSDAVSSPPHTRANSSPGMSDNLIGSI
jgi:hypothetical protein